MRTGLASGDSPCPRCAKRAMGKSDRRSRARMSSSGICAPETLDASVLRKSPAMRNLIVRSTSAKHFMESLSTRNDDTPSRTRRSYKYFGPRELTNMDTHAASLSGCAWFLPIRSGSIIFNVYSSLILFAEKTDAHSIGGSSSSRSASLQSSASTAALRGRHPRSFHASFATSSPRPKAANIISKHSRDDERALRGTDSAASGTMGGRGRGRPVFSSRMYSSKALGSSSPSAYCR